MLISFALSMPSNNSWNGTWTGQDKTYAVIVNAGSSKHAAEKAAALIQKGYYTHAFGDGWVAAVRVREVDAKEARKIRRKSSGFCGYDWMIRSIRDHGEIRA